MVEHGSSGLQVVDVLNKLNREMVVNSFMLKRLLAKVDTIETYIKYQEIDSTGTHTRTSLEPEFFSQFPIKNSEEFTLLENRIRNESGYVLKMVHNILIYKNNLIIFWV